MNDLFGDPVIDRELPQPTQAKKKNRKYIAKGYAAAPGTGPAGHYCRDCLHSYYNENRRGSKRFWKCDLVKPTCGIGTDIRVGSPACRFWKEKVTA